MARRSTYVLLSIAALALFGLGASLHTVGGKRFTLPGKRVAIVGASGETFVRLHVSWLHQATYADGKEGRFRTTYDGPVELVSRSNGRLVTRRALGVELSGQFRRPEITIRLIMTDSYQPLRKRRSKCSASAARSGRAAGSSGIDLSSAPSWA